MPEPMHNRLIVFRAYVGRTIATTRPDRRFINGQTARGFFRELRNGHDRRSLETVMQQAELRLSEEDAIQKFICRWRTTLPETALMEAIKLLMDAGILRRRIVQDGLRMLQSAMRMQPDLTGFMEWQLPLLVRNRWLLRIADFPEMEQPGNIRLLEETRAALERVHTE